MFAIDVLITCLMSGACGQHLEGFDYGVCKNLTETLDTNHLFCKINEHFLFYTEKQYGCHLFPTTQRDAMLFTPARGGNMLEGFVREKPRLEPADFSKYYFIVDGREHNANTDKGMCIKLTEGHYCNIFMTRDNCVLMKHIEPPIRVTTLLIIVGIGILVIVAIIVGATVLAKVRGASQSYYIEETESPGWQYVGFYKTTTPDTSVQNTDTMDTMSNSVSGEGFGRETIVAAMFYAQFVLSKKGPLAKIWLAAHWEKKLSKAQIYETNVEDAVNEILEPKSKIALRTTGHLLLGIVRIYSRKTKYLLADCNEAFLKIKMAFRPGQMELFDEPHDMPKTSITLPEVIQDFDAALPEFGDLEMVSLNNQSRVDDITLKDDTGFDINNHGTFGNDFGMDDFGESALGGGGGDLMDFGMHDDVHGVLNSDAATNDGRFLREQTPCLDGRVPMGEMIFGDDDLGGSSGAMDDFVESVEGGQDDSQNSSSMMERAREASVAPDSIMQTGTAATTTLLHESTPSLDQPSESFHLEPLDPNALEKTAVKPRRKRRLIIDEQKNISGEEMKNNMADYSDTLQGVDIAPPTKKLMRVKESGNVEKLYHYPGSSWIKNRQLVRLYQSHLLLPVKRPTAATSTSRETIETVRRELEMSDQIDDADTSLPLSDTAGFDDDYNVDMFEMPSGGDSPTPTEMEQPVEEETKEDEVKEEEKKRKKRTQQEKVVVDDDEAVEGDEDHRWTKRTQNVINSIAAKLKVSETGEITMNDLLTKGSTRKTAAQKFYTLLVLKKWQAIDVRQDAPFADIHIRAGPNINQSHS